MSEPRIAVTYPTPTGHRSSFPAQEVKVHMPDGSVYTLADVLEYVVAQYRAKPVAKSGGKKKAKTVTQKNELFNG